jgi:hypothetical protein
VAVEKAGFSEKSRKSGDRKCPGDWEKSFVELPDAIQFLQIPSERVFQQPRDLSTVIGRAGVYSDINPAFKESRGVPITLPDRLIGKSVVSQLTRHVFGYLCCI